MALLAVSDLLKRWVRPPKGQGIYTRQGVHKLMHRPDFPAPEIDTGSVKLWRLSVITGFEEAHPELTDGDAKWRKIRKAGRRALYARRMKGAEPPPNV